MTHPLPTSSDQIVTSQTFTLYTDVARFKGDRSRIDKLTLMAKLLVLIVAFLLLTCSFIQGALKLNLL